MAWGFERIDPGDGRIEAGDVDEYRRGDKTVGRPPIKDEA